MTTPLVRQPILAPTQQIFLSGSGTYTLPANVAWIRVRMVGGGGGGAGSGTASGTAAGDGTASTFGSALLSAGGAGTGGTVGGLGGSGIIIIEEHQY